MTRREEELNNLELKFMPKQAQPLGLLCPTQIMLLGIRDGFVIDRYSLRLCAIAQGIVNAGAARVVFEDKHERHFEFTDAGIALRALLHDFRDLAETDQ